jgi:hypothetical protein
MTNAREDSTTTSHFPAPTWALSADDDGDGSILWSRKVELAAVEFDGWASLTVGAYLFDTIVIDDAVGVVIDRGTPEIEITRNGPDGEADPLEEPLRFEVAGARRVAAVLLELCDAVEDIEQG